MEFDGITLVTGAAGFMGSHVVEYLAKMGVRVRATARPRKASSETSRLGSGKVMISRTGGCRGGRACMDNPVYPAPPAAASP